MAEKLARLGKGRFAVPAAVVLLAFCVFGLMMYPLLNATPKDVPSPS